MKCGEFDSGAENFFFNIIMQIPAQDRSGEDEYISTEWTRILMTRVIRSSEILPFIILCGVAIDSNFH